jgi:LmbE family N-acetylglucosaminyl deacetylase
MLPLQLPAKRPLRLLCLGAHSDDLEIGCGGTLMRWLREGRELDVSWVVLGAAGERMREAQRSAAALLRGAVRRQVTIGQFPDAQLPSQMKEVKAFFERLKRETAPDLILTHRLEDRHQDHRLVAELSWQTWRDHLIWEYEIPKYEGDLGQPSLYVPLAKADASRKVRHLLKHFGTQRARDWFRQETFEAIMRLRAIECRAAGGFAEAFYVRKAVI